MSKKNSLWSRLQGWVQKLLSPTSKQNTNSQVKERLSEQHYAEHLSEKVEPSGLPVQSQTPIETFRRNVSTLPYGLHASRAASAKLDSPFLLGLDKLADLETLSTENFLKLIPWNFDSQTSSAKISGYPIVDDLSDSKTLSTEDVLTTIEWDLESVPSVKPVASASLAPCFLLGLDDLPNLDNLLTKELLNLIKWEADSQMTLPIEAEDLSLLEDLLGNFPE